MATIATAPGKVILFGEHAVVYGAPAIAIPVTQVEATATVANGTQHVVLRLPDMGRRLLISAETVPTQTPIIEALHQVRRHLNLPELPPLDVTVSSTIPMASGLGSGAALSAALIRALLTHLNAPPPPATVSALTYNVEMLFHGTPPASTTPLSPTRSPSTSCARNQ